MKLLSILLLFPLLLFSQTNYDVKDIRAVATHSFQTLITNRVGIDAFEVSEAGAFIDNKYNLRGDVFECGKNCNEWIYKNKPIGDINQREIRFKLFWDTLPNGEKLSKKVVFTGDNDLLIRFFIDYWHTKLDFDSIKKGEVASVRFLSDVATFSWTPKGAKIEVVTAKDR